MTVFTIGYELRLWTGSGVSDERSARFKVETATTVWASGETGCRIVGKTTSLSHSSMSHGVVGAQTASTW
jgi:hypothetical protein